MANYDEPMVKEALHRVSHIGNISEKARRIGVSEGTVRRWMRGDIPTLRGPRAALENFLGVSDYSSDQMERVVAEWEAKEAADASVVSVVNETKGGG